MNFNLSSPTENGNLYTINFKEQIVIPPNSSIRLNFAELTRSSNIVFEENQTMSIVNGLVLPTVYPSERTKSNDPFKPDKDTVAVNSFTINKGKYTFLQLLTAIFEGIQTLITPSRMTQYTGTFSEGIRGFADNDFIFGIRLTSGVGSIESPFEPKFNDFNLPISSTDKHLAITDPDPDTGFSYKKQGGVDGTYDSYAFTANHLYHLCPNPLLTLENERAPIQNLIRFTSTSAYGSNTGSFTVGLNGKEYADGLIKAFTRTSGNNPPVLKNNKPTAFFAVEFSDGGDTKISFPRKGLTRPGNTIPEWTTQDEEIVAVRYKNLGPNTFTPYGANGVPVLTKPLTGYFQLYQRPQDILENTFRLYVRILTLKVGLSVGNTIDDFDIIYDSQADEWYFPYEFFVSEELTTGASATPNTVNSQIPFVLGLYATHNGEGLSCNCATFDKLTNTASNDKPNTMVHNYNFNFSDELGKVFNTNASRLLSGNIGETDVDYQFARDLSVNWKTSNYSILLENLPMANRKNTTEKREGATKRPILANIPSPFGTSNEQVNIFGSEQQIISVYQPYNVIETALLNEKEISTNQMKVKIVQMNDDTPAKEITKSVVNFTIY